MGSFEGLDVVYNLVERLKEGNQAVIDLEIVLRANKARFESLCGGEDGSLDAFHASLTDIGDRFDSFIDVAEDTTDLLSCEPINALYKEFMHGDVCENLPITSTWIFSTMLLFVFFGITVFSLRGALLPPIPLDTQGYESKRQYEGYKARRNRSFSEHSESTEFSQPMHATGHHQGGTRQDRRPNTGNSVDSSRQERPDTRSSSDGSSQERSDTRSSYEGSRQKIRR
jgi:hypothetical protein